MSMVATLRRDEMLAVLSAPFVEESRERREEEDVRAIAPCSA